jgi:hypothetical protein
VCDDPGQCAVQLPDVDVDAACQLGEDITLRFKAGLADQASENGEAGGEIGRLDRNRQPPLEAVSETGLEGRELTGNAVSGEEVWKNSSSV